MSQIPCQSYGQLFQIEKHLEDGFAALLKNVAGIPNVIQSKHEKIIEAPYLSVEVSDTQVLRHAHIINEDVPEDQMQQVWDGYGGTLSTTITTRRPDDVNALLHNSMVGETRAALQMFLLVPVWCKYMDIVLVTDIREESCVHTFDDEKNLDHSTISWDLVTNINPLAWPVSH